MANEALNLRLKNFRIQYQYDKMSDTELFNRFVNVGVLSQHQPDAFSTDIALLDSISIQDTSLQITGVAIKINGILVKSISEIQDFISKSDITLDIEYIFIATNASSETFSKERASEFVQNVKSFFEKDGFESEKMNEWLDIRNYIKTEEVVSRWNSKKCAVRCYLVQKMEWTNLDFLKETLTAEIKKNTSQHFSLKDIHFINEDELLDIVMQNDNQMEVELHYKERLELPETEDVGNVYLLLCNAVDYIKILNTREGLINKSLFNDNVRDYQGFTSVNKEIYNTIKESPENFIFFNNGITIVCSDFKPETHKLKIKNPQIVNGCQTSSILFDANGQGLNISKINVWVKVIATQNIELANAIVRGTNKQNIVPDEAFETIKDFHKKFEDYITQLDVPTDKKLYYERRAKQYANNPKVLALQKISIRNLTRCTVSGLLLKPEMSLHHEAYILKELGKQLFQDTHCYAPYYAIMLANMNILKALQYMEKRPAFSKNTTHLLYVYVLKVCGNCPVDLANPSESNIFTNKILDNISNKQEFAKCIQEVVEIYEQCANIWTKKLNKNIFRMKDNAQFSKLLSIATQNNISSYDAKELKLILDTKV